jgi:amino acid adenylation domain-containing protein
MEQRSDESLSLQDLNSGSPRVRDCMLGLQAEEIECKSLTVESTLSIAPPNLIDADCESITPAMLTLVELDQRQIEGIAQTVPGSAKNIQDIYPLTPLQEGLLFHHLLNQQGDAYVLSTLLELQSRAQLDALTNALQAVIDRHDILRTAVLWEELPRPVQVVYRRAPLPVDLLALERDLDLVEQLKERMTPQRQKWNLRQAPLVRLQVAPDPSGSKWYALLQLHHVICDYGSLRNVIAEVVANLSGRAHRLPAPVAYRDHVAQVLANPRAQDAERFFRSKLGDIDEPTAPFGLTNVRGDGTRIKEARQELGPALSKRLRLQAKSLGMSAARLFHVAWALVVAHTSARDDVVFGTVLLANWQRIVTGPRILGMSINTLPLRLRLRAVTIKELVEQTQRELTELLSYDQVPLVLAQRCSGISGSTPLFSTLLNFRRVTPDHEAEWTSVAGIRVLAVPEARTNYPITLTVDDLGEGFGLTAQTDGRVDPRRMAGYVSTAMQSLVEALERAPETPALALSILPESERREILEAFNATQAAYSEEKLVHELFEEQVRQTPDATAVVHEGESLTYAVLNGRANLLARYLRNQGVGPDQLVGIFLERGLEMVVGLLGILKAGGAYMPLDPNYPPERLQQMLEDAAPEIVLTQTELMTVLPATQAEVIALDEQMKEIPRDVEENTSAAELGLTARHLIYVIYTSGSTGRPKGTAMAHRSMVNLIEWHRTSFGTCEGRHVLQFAALSFDVAFQEIFSTLCTGGTLVLLDEWIRRDARALTEFLNSHSIQRLFVPPLMLQSLAKSSSTTGVVPGHLQDVITAGEQLRISPEVVALFKRLDGCRLHNHYGPTETHVVTALTLTGNPDQWPSLPAIGRPISNTQIYVLDGERQLVPIGVAGEIYVGGAGVARGYLGRTELTAQRFIDDPLNSERGARLYRTGDLGRWRSDGTLEYLGRNDYQVKIRGYRVELGEIEAQLARHAQVKEAAVIAREDAPGERRLVAYVTRRDQGDPTVEELRAHLKAVLPEYMVPSAIVMLECLPLTPSGKLDRRALPMPELDAYASPQYEAPQGGVEETLAAIWEQLLRVERVGRNDNFFELGGHSLLIVQLIDRLRRVALSVSVHRVFESPTLADLASALTSESVGQFEVPPNLIPQECEVITPQMLPLVELEAEHIERVVQAVPGGAANIQDIYSLAPLQEGILFHHLISEHSDDAYARSLLLSLPSREKLENFVAALQEVIDRHDILRTAVLWEQLPRPVQVVYRQATLPIEEFALDWTRDPIAQLKERLKPDAYRLDLRRAPLMRLQIAADPHGAQWYALLRTHHLVFDNESLQTMLAEVIAHASGRAQELPKPVPYRNHVARALAYARLPDAEVYFRGKLGDIDEPTAPFGLLDVRGDGGRIETACHTLKLALAQQIRAQARHLHVSAATLFHASWALVVSRTSGRDDVVFGSVLLGRLHGSPGAQRILGMLINTLPLRLKLEGMTANELIAQTQQEIAGLLDHEQASLPLAQRCSGIVGSAPLFSAVLNYVRRPVDLQSDLSAAAGVRLLESHGRTNYPLLLTVYDQGEGFTLEMKTHHCLDPNRILGYVSTAMQSLVEALERAPQTQALLLPILPENERIQVIDSFNTTLVPYPQEKLLHELFEEQVARTPGAAAVLYEDESLTYDELNGKANQLARYLRNRGVGPEQLVALCVERSVWMLVGMFAVMKAGAAYVPLDPTNPTDRLEHLLTDAAPRVLLTQERLTNRLPLTTAEVITLDTDWSEIGKLNAGNLDPRLLRVSQRNLAYVIYTSGSTGKPKGVMVEHRNIVNYAVHAARQFDVAFGGGSVICTSISFDLMLTGLFPTLLCGRAVRLCRDEKGLPALSSAVLQSSNLAPLKLTPSHLALLEPALRSGELADRVRVLVLGGEPLQASVAQLWRKYAPRTRIFNHYGPTETTVGCAVYELGENPSGTVPIGRPISNTQIYILDSHLQPAPIGVAGEIYIGGAGVARGYLNRPELTTERFVEDPFSHCAGARLYKSGDLGRWRADGVVEYLGRNDDQVKIRGHRIEPGEIEAQLMRHAQVKKAVVTAREDVPGEKRLVAYVTPGDSVAAAPSAEVLRAYLSAVLPDYMVPSAFVALDHLPLTPNGKLDRRALPVPEFGAYSHSRYEPPQGEVEKILAGIWQALLRADRVGRHDNFFDLGGHSLLATRVISRIREAFGVEVPVRVAFDEPTLIQLSARVETGVRAKAAQQAMRRETLGQELRQKIDEMPDDAVMAQIAALENELGGIH